MKLKFKEKIRIKKKEGKMINKQQKVQFILQKH